MPEPTEPKDFIRTIVEQDLRSNKHGGRVHTRFPPEPNGYLHIGHAKAICIDFGVAADYGGLTNLRFDDTNPSKEDMEYVESMKRDIHWLGFDWGDREYYASDYFEHLYAYAVQLIKMGKAYVCDLSPNEMREYRGTASEPGRESPYRNRSVEENLDLFARMRAGEFDEGSRTLRAKIDMASPNFLMRDPVIYRILKVPHQRLGDQWCIYPMYDFTHCLSDSLEGITHSLCSLEFENNRELYDWYLETLDVFRSHQYEFSRLFLSYTTVRKRRLLPLIQAGIASGWDDPRMPTLAGLRRRGYTPESIRAFCDAIGVSKANSLIDVAMLEHFVRQDLDNRAPRVMGVLRPLKVIIDNYPEGQVEQMTAYHHPSYPERGTRQVPFSRELWIEREDFMENPPSKFFRLGPGREVRLRYAYFVTCVGVDKDASGEVTALHCTYDPATRGGDAPDGRKVRGTIHWVSAESAVPAEVRLYDRLFKVENPDEGDPLENVNLESRTVLEGCYVEPSLADAPAGSSYQFERQGYFCVDPDSTPGRPVFNQTVGLRDTWAKIAGQG